MAIEYGISSLHIIESLEGERKTGRELMDRLRLKSGITAEIPKTHHEVNSEKDLFTVLDTIFAADASNAPILHFEVHGASSHLKLRNADYVAWDEISPRLARFNVASRFNLLVVMACCDGIHLINSLTTDNICPFSGVVGCQGKIFPSELIGGFERFYEILFTEGKASQALHALQSAVVKSKETQFHLLTCEDAFSSVAKRVYAENLDSHGSADRVEKFRVQLEQMRVKRGIRLRTTTEEVRRLLAESDRDVMENFHATFFALAQVPENEARFQFDKLASR